MSTSLAADVTFGYIEIVPLTRDSDGACTTECDSGDWSAQVKQENLPAVKQETEDVRCVVFMWQQFINVCEWNIQFIILLFTCFCHQTTVILKFSWQPLRH